MHHQWSVLTQIVLSALLSSILARLYRTSHPARNTENDKHTDYYENAFFLLHDIPPARYMYVI